MSDDLLMTLNGPAIENLVETDMEHGVSDAVVGFRHLGLDDAAALVGRAAAAYPSVSTDFDEDEEADAEAEAAWEALDEDCFATVTDELIEAAVRARFPHLVPESLR